MFGLVERKGLIGDGMMSHRRRALNGKKKLFPDADFVWCVFPFRKVPVKGDKDVGKVNLPGPSPPSVRIC